MKKIILSGFVFIFIITFIFAAHTITNSTSIIPEDVNSVVTINVDNTDTLEAANISVVNITLPSGFIFMTDSNSTNAGTHTFSNTSDVLSWSNDGLVMNITNKDFSFNVTVATAGNYSLTISTLNVSGLSSSEVNITINDTTYPTVSLTTPVAGGNISGNYSLTTTITEDTASLVYFNMTNASGDAGTFTASNTSGTSWNSTMDTTLYSEGLYNISVWANDSNNQINDTVIATGVRIDNTNPSVTSFSCSPTSVYTTNPVICSCTGSDADSGVASTSYTASPQVSTIGTFIETCTVTDRAGNTASSTTTYTVNTRTSSTPASTESKEWSMTYTATGDKFENGYRRTMKEKERIKVKINNEDHYIGIKDLTTDSATIEIASDPIEITLDVGEDAKADINNDGFYDILVILNSISSNRADVTVTKISEEIPEGVEESIETTGEIVTPEEEVIPEVVEEKSKWRWFILIVLLLIVVGGVFFLKPGLLKKLKKILKPFNKPKRENLQTLKNSFK